MTAKKIAEKTGVHYQTVLREIRKTVKKEDPKFLEGVSGTGTGNRKAHDFDEKKTAYLLGKIDALKSLKSTWNAPKGSNQNQRREWSEEWNRRMGGQNIEKWSQSASVLAAISISASIESLNSVVGDERTGDLALRMIAEFDRALLKTDPFALWLQEAKFTAPV